DEPRWRGALALKLDLATRLEREDRVERLSHALRELQPAGDRGRFEAAGDIDRVAPHVEGELPAADDAGHDRAGVQADAHLPAMAGVLDDVEHLEAEVGGGRDGRWSRQIEPGDRHVRVADRLDLLDAEPNAGFVELCEQLVEVVDELGRSETTGDGCEA